MATITAELVPPTMALQPPRTAGGSKPKNVLIWNQATIDDPDPANGNKMKVSCKYCSRAYYWKQFNATRFSTHLVECTACAPEIKLKIKELRITVLLHYHHHHHHCYYYYYYYYYYAFTKISHFSYIYSMYVQKFQFLLLISPNLIVNY